MSSALPAKRSEFNLVTPSLHHLFALMETRTMANQAHELLAGLGIFGEGAAHGAGGGGSQTFGYNA